MLRSIRRDARRTISLLTSSLAGAAFAAALVWTPSAIAQEGDTEPGAMVIEVPQATSADDLRPEFFWTDPVRRELPDAAALHERWQHEADAVRARWN